MNKVGERYKKALVTGGSSGLGQAFVEMLLADGVEVWAASRRPESLPRHPLLHPLRLDLANPPEVEAFCRRFVEDVPDVDLLINNAGYGVFSPFDEFPERELTQQINVMLAGPIIICHHLYAGMRKRGRGAIVNVSSLAADFPVPCLSLYNTAKAGLSGFSRSLLLEAHGSGVTVIDLQPGDFRTAFNQNVRRDEALLRRTPALGSLWQTLERNLRGGPEPSLAARDLRRWLLAGRSGTLVTGGFFQARLGPFLARFATRKLVLYFLRKYYQFNA